RQLPDYQIAMAQNLPGCVGVASSLVTTAATYQNIIANLLGTTVIVTDMSAAIPMAQQLKHRVRLVTLDAQIMHVGRSITGGTTRQHGNGVHPQNAQINQYTQQESEYHQATLASEQQGKQVEQQHKEVTDAVTQHQARWLTA